RIVIEEIVEIERPRTRADDQHAATEPMAARHGEKQHAAIKARAQRNTHPEESDRRGAADAAEDDRIGKYLPHDEMHEYQEDDRAESQRDSQPGRRSREVD